MKRIVLDTMVTLVDASTFVQDYASRLPVAARPELGDGGNMRPVVDLLVEQVECADFVVLNKIDLAPGGADGVAQLAAIASSLNPLATVVACERGRVDIQQVFGAASRKVVAALNTEGQHRGAVAAARAQAAEEAAAAGEAGGSSGDAGCAQCAAAKGGGGGGGAAEGSGSGAAAHGEEGHARGEGCAGGHDHHDHHHHHHHHDHGGHKHGVHVGGGHKHGHGDGHHHHHHHHGHHHHHHGPKERAETRAARRFGIRSFVYARRRPFHPQR